MLKKLVSVIGALLMLAQFAVPVFAEAPAAGDLPVVEETTEAAEETPAAAEDAAEALSGVSAAEGAADEAPAEEEAQPAADSYALSGKLEAGDTGASVKSKTVRLVKAGTPVASKTTGSNGSFSFAGVEPGGYTLEVDADFAGAKPYRAVSQAVTVESADLTGQVLRLQKPFGFDFAVFGMLEPGVTEVAGNGGLIVMADMEPRWAAGGDEVRVNVWLDGEPTTSGVLAGVDIAPNASLTDLGVDIEKPEEQSIPFVAGVRPTGRLTFSFTLPESVERAEDILLELTYDEAATLASTSAGSIKLGESAVAFTEKTARSKTVEVTLLNLPASVAPTLDWAPSVAGKGLSAAFTSWGDTTGVGTRGTLTISAADTALASDSAYTLTLASGGKTADITVTVEKDEAVKGIRFDPNALYDPSLPSMGKEIEIISGNPAPQQVGYYFYSSLYPLREADYTPDDQADERLVAVTSNGNVATVVLDETGKKVAITPVGPGRVDISVVLMRGKAELFKDTISLLVSKPLSASNPVTIAPAAPEEGMLVGESIQLGAQLNPADAVLARQEWSVSGDGQAAAITQTGKLTALAAASDVTVTLKAWGLNQATNSPTLASWTVDIIDKADGVAILDGKGQPVSNLLVYLKDGDTQDAIDLAALVTPYDDAGSLVRDEDAAIVWSHSGSAVTLDWDGEDPAKNGKATLTPVKTGTATFTATAKTNKKLKATLTVKVVKAPAAAIEIHGASLLTDKPLQVGKTHTIKAKVKDSTSTKAPSGYFEWVSSNPAVATVSEKGVIKGVSPGSFRISIFIDGAEVDVSPEMEVVMNVTALGFAHGNITLAAGSYALLPTLPVDDAALQDPAAWPFMVLPTPFDPALAAQGRLVWKQGAVRGAGLPGVVIDYEANTVSLSDAGKVKLTATDPLTNKSASFTLTVGDAPAVASIAIQPKTAVSELRVGKSHTLKVDIQPTEAAADGYYWYSSATDIISVSPKGVIKALKASDEAVGITVVSAANPGKTATIQVRATEAAKSVALYKQADYEQSGKKAKQGTLTLNNALGNTAGVIALASPAVTGGRWSYSFSTLGIATVQEKPYPMDGQEAILLELSYARPGTTKLTVGYGTRKATLTIKCVEYANSTMVKWVDSGSLPGKAEDYTITDKRPGNTLDLAAKLEWTAGIAKKTPAWASSNTGVATVSKSGKVTGKAPGLTVITATFPGTGMVMARPVRVVKSTSPDEDTLIAMYTYYDGATGAWERLGDSIHGLSFPMEVSKARYLRVAYMKYSGMAESSNREGHFATQPVTLAPGSYVSSNNAIARAEAAPDYLGANTFKLTTGARAGKATLTVAAGAHTDKITLQTRVFPASLADITLKANKQELPAGGTLDLAVGKAASLSASFANSKTGLKKVQYELETNFGLAPNGATMPAHRVLSLDAAKGRVTAIAPGTATIRVTHADLPGRSFAFKVKVFAPVAGLTMLQAGITLPVYGYGDSNIQTEEFHQKLYVRVNGMDWMTDAELDVYQGYAGNILWSSSNPIVAGFRNIGNGNIQSQMAGSYDAADRSLNSVYFVGRAPGEATITATNVETGLKASFKLKVAGHVADVTDVKMQKSELVVRPGATTTLKADVLPESAGNTALGWRLATDTEDAGVVMPDSGITLDERTGKLTVAKTVGFARLKVVAASLNNAVVNGVAQPAPSAVCWVTVRTAPQKLVFDSAAYSTLVGGEAISMKGRLAATPAAALDERDTQLWDSLVWTVANPDLFRVERSGGDVLLVPQERNGERMRGTTTLTVRESGGKKASVPVSVTPLPPSLPEPGDLAVASEAPLEVEVSWSALEAVERYELVSQASGGGSHTVTVNGRDAADNGIGAGEGALVLENGKYTYTTRREPGAYTYTLKAHFKDYDSTDPTATKTTQASREVTVAVPAATVAGFGATVTNASTVLLDESNGRIVLDWTPLAAATGADGYRVEKSTDNISYTLLKDHDELVVDGNDKPRETFDKSDDGLFPATRYYRICPLYDEVLAKDGTLLTYAKGNYYYAESAFGTPIGPFTVQKITA